MIQTYKNLDPSQYVPKIQELINSHGVIIFEGMEKSDFDSLLDTFNNEINTKQILSMSWVPINKECQVII